MGWRGSFPASADRWTNTFTGNFFRVRKPAKKLVRRIPDERIPFQLDAHFVCRRGGRGALYRMAGPLQTRFWCVTRGI